MSKFSQPDVVMIYQERDDVELAIQQIVELDIDFKAYKYNPKKRQNLTEMRPKVLLLSSNNIKTTIELYISYLEKYEQNIAPHSAILLINNRETYRAYLACENGLFDNYVIINPLNEPHRLKLVLLQELKLIESHKNIGLEQLISEGEDELASCIEHGVTLKKSFTQYVDSYKNELTVAATDSHSNSEAALVLQKLIGISFDEMNENVSAEIQMILNQLIELKQNHQNLREGVEKCHTPKKKTVVGLNKALLMGEEQNHDANKTSRFKVLIAEPSDLFTRVIDEIFSETVFKYLLVNDGESALTHIASFKPDVLLLAYDLPNINGLEITRTLRDANANIPVIAYVHPRDKAIIKRWIPLGISGYLVKPSKRSAILSSISKAVKDPIKTIRSQAANGTDVIQWIPEYSIGNREIDEQHKVLFTMVNGFFHQEGKENAMVLFQNLSSYIDLHFNAEENLLRQINYPDTEEHIKKHEELREKFERLQEKLADYDIDVHHRIAMFLYNWLAKHILKSDMAYRAYALSIEEESFDSQIP